MLKPAQLRFQFALVVIIDKHERAEGLAVRGLDVLFDQLLSHDVPDGFRAVRVAFPRNEFVELSEELLLHGDAEAVERFHSVLRF